MFPNLGGKTLEILFVSHWGESRIRLWHHMIFGRSLKTSPDTISMWRICYVLQPIPVYHFCDTFLHFLSPPLPSLSSHSKVFGHRGLDPVKLALFTLCCDLYMTLPSFPLPSPHPCPSTLKNIRFAPKYSSKSTIKHLHERNMYFILIREAILCIWK